jgi:hypothetical protein
MKYPLKIKDERMFDNFRIWIEETYFDGQVEIDYFVWRKAMADALAQYNAIYDYKEYMVEFDTESDKTFFLLRFS